MSESLPNELKQAFPEFFELKKLQPVDLDKAMHDIVSIGAEITRGSKIKKRGDNR